MSDAELATRIADALKEIGRLRLMVDWAANDRRLPARRVDMCHVLDRIEGALLDAWREFRQNPTPATRRRVNEAIAGWPSVWLEALEQE